MYHRVLGISAGKSAAKSAPGLDFARHTLERTGSFQKPRFLSRRDRVAAREAEAERDREDEEAGRKGVGEAVVPPGRKNTNTCPYLEQVGAIMQMSTICSLVYMVIQWRMDQAMPHAWVYSSLPKDLASRSGGDWQKKAAEAFMHTYNGGDYYWWLHHMATLGGLCCAAFALGGQIILQRKLRAARQKGVLAAKEVIRERSDDMTSSAAALTDKDVVDRINEDADAEALQSAEVRAARVLAKSAPGADLPADFFLEMPQTRGIRGHF